MSKYVLHCVAHYIAYVHAWMQDMHICFQRDIYETISTHGRGATASVQLSSQSIIYNLKDLAVATKVKAVCKAYFIG